jgi:hypothetical protein
LAITKNDSISDSKMKDLDVFSSSSSSGFDTTLQAIKETSE